jgi:hypothetical protein
MKYDMASKDLIEKNAAIFKAQGQAIEQYANRSIKVLVVANPANTNCLIAMTYAPSIPKKNFTALVQNDTIYARNVGSMTLSYEWHVKEATPHVIMYRHAWTRSAYGHSSCKPYNCNHGNNPTFTNRVVLYMTKRLYIYIYIHIVIFSACIYTM